MLTLAFIYALLISAGFLFGVAEYDRAIYRVIGPCGLVVRSIVMRVTVRHWVGWFLGALGYFVLKTIVAMLLGSSIARPRMWFIEFPLLPGIAILLCLRCVGRKALKIELAGLVGVVLALLLFLLKAVEIEEMRA